MGKLDKTTTYLCGPIDRAGDDGKGWRQAITALLQKHNLNIEILDPTNKPEPFRSETGVEKHEALQLAKEARWDELTALMEGGMHLDLRFVDKSDFLICVLPDDICTVGTVHEVVVASWQSKPILVIAPNGKARVPFWYFGLIKWQNIFDTAEELVEHLVKLDNDKEPLSKEWVLWQ